MKIFIVSLCIFTINAISLFACDACGGGMVLSSDIYGLSLKNSFGINYSYAKFENLGSTDKLHQIDLIGTASCLKNKLILTLRVPLHNKTRSFTENTTNKSIKGLGDAMFLANYVVYQQKEQISKVSIKGQVGAGLKLWNAPYDHYIELEDVPKQFNLGSESPALILRTHWFVNTGNWGLDVQANFSKMFENSDQFKFGNQLTIQAMWSKSFAIGKSGILSPYVGLLSETVGQDRYKGNNFDEESGGNALYGKITLACVVNKFAILPQINIPLTSNYANNSVENKCRFSLLLNYSF